VFQRITHRFELIIYLLLGILLLAASNPIAGEPIDRARAYTRPIEFDYFRWMADATMLKLQGSSLGVPGYFTREDRRQIVMQHLYLTERILQAENQLNQLFADPTITDKNAASAHLRGEMDVMDQRQKQLASLAEAVLQGQVSEVLAEQNLTAGGQPIPPVLYHASPLPMNLIISKRDRIERITSISVQPALPVDQQVVLEEQVDDNLSVSSLVVPVGGIGVYPSMVMRSTYLPSHLNTVAHEWAHNFLTLRPLGMLYDETPELRIINETTASIVGNEIAYLTIQRFYPEMIGASSPPIQLAATKPGMPIPEGEPPPFDYRAEMHTTRITTDQLLAEGKIEEAEAYMESRRAFFWENGYAIRKLNQAFFAFYGAYADVPGGAAGEDPVGPAVRALREQSSSLADFLNRISWMTSFEQLQASIQQGK
jgi:hypothetical protein